MKEFENDITNSIRTLHNGGLILYPTDTIWGIGSAATNETAVRKIYLLKKRQEKKSMIILLANAADINDYVSRPSDKMIDFISAQEQPTTAIFASAKNLPGSLINDDGSIAIRIVKNDFCRALIGELKGPLVSTSANISGRKHPQVFAEIDDIIKNGVDYIVQHRQNETEVHQPSSIVKLNSQGGIEKIR